MKVGITGHQNLGSAENITWLSKTLQSAIKQNSVDIGLTSLAIGADQLFAETLKDMDIRYVAIIPCDGYQQTFTNSSDLERYNSLLQNAFEVVQLPFVKPSEEAFYEAGKQIANNSDMIIAIWDGQPAKGLGGTGDIVKYAQALKRSILHINPVIQTVSHL
ncbi:MAG: hypothetical protein ACYDER_01310 [Ktedonobacteraceae bacterium]